MATPSEEKGIIETIEKATGKDAISVLTDSEQPAEREQSTKKVAEECTNMRLESVENAVDEQGSPGFKDADQNKVKEDHPALLSSAISDSREDYNSSLAMTRTIKRAAEDDSLLKSDSKRPKLDDVKMELERNEDKVEGIEDGSSLEVVEKTGETPQVDAVSHSHVIRQRIMALLEETGNPSGDNVDERRKQTTGDSRDALEGEDNAATETAAGSPKDGTDFEDTAASSPDDKIAAAVIDHSTSPANSVNGEDSASVDTCAQQKRGFSASCKPTEKFSENDPGEVIETSSIGKADAVFLEDGLLSPAAQEQELRLANKSDTSKSLHVASLKPDSDEEATFRVLQISGVSGETQEDINKVKQILQDRRQAEASNDAFMDGWYNWVNELVEYHNKHGHCQVRDAESHALYNWLKRQRVMFRKGKLEEDKLIILRLLKTKGFEVLKNAKAKPPPEPASKRKKSPKKAKPKPKKKRLKNMRSAAQKIDLANAVARAGARVAGTLTDSTIRSSEGVASMPISVHDRAVERFLAREQHHIMPRRQDPAGSLLFAGRLPDSLGVQLPSVAVSSVQGTMQALNDAAASDAHLQVLGVTGGLPSNHVLLLLQQQARERALQEELQRRQRQRDLLRLRQLLQHNHRPAPRGDP